MDSNGTRRWAGVSPYVSKPFKINVAWSGRHSPLTLGRRRCPCGKWTVRNRKPTARTCACWPSASWTPRRSTTTWNLSSFTWWRWPIPKGVTASAISVKRKVRFHLPTLQQLKGSWGSFNFPLHVWEKNRRRDCSWIKYSFLKGKPPPDPLNCKALRPVSTGSWSLLHIYSRLYTTSFLFPG